MERGARNISDIVIGGALLYCAGGLIFVVMPVYLAHAQIIYNISRAIWGGCRVPNCGPSHVRRLWVRFGSGDLIGIRSPGLVHFLLWRGR